MGVSVAEVESWDAGTLIEWAAFERVYGPITLHERVDAAGAIAAYGSLVAMGAKDVNPEDLLPDWSGAAPKRGQSVEEMIAVMRSIGKPKE